jgi:ubiquinone/menaquinone biosynthesis C-methylase UbiE
MNITVKRPQDQAGNDTGHGLSLASPAEIPAYLRLVYWWAYIHPTGVRLFDRPWVTNLILWGNFRRLRDAAIAALGPRLTGRTLQVACVYSDFTQALLRAMAPEARLDVVDVVPAQLDNLAAKLPAGAAVELHCLDATRLAFPDACFDQVILFFLLHEQPADVRAATLAEALRVLRPGGRMVVMDYHRPAWWHPLRYLFAPVLRWLEPFALDLWRRELPVWLPPTARPARVNSRRFFGGLYQLVMLTR